MKQLIANMRHAARSNQESHIGGGVFSADEIRSVLHELEVIRSALDHYAHGGSEYRKQAAHALQLFDN